MIKNEDLNEIRAYTETLNFLRGDSRFLDQSRSLL